MMTLQDVIDAAVATLASPTTSRLVFEARNGRIYVESHGPDHTRFDVSITEPFPAIIGLVNWIVEQRGKKIEEEKYHGEIPEDTLCKKSSGP